jgi:hypothetical protein
VFWVISVSFNIRNTLPKFGTFFLGHPVYLFVLYTYIILCLKLLQSVFNLSHLFVLLIDANIIYSTVLLRETSLYLSVIISNSTVTDALNFT